MEPLPFKEQIKVYASSQVLLMTHGAALVNIMFMPEVSIGPSSASCAALISCSSIHEPGLRGFHSAVADCAPSEAEPGV